MEGNARTWFAPKQKAELWERWKSGHGWRTSPERLRGGTRAEAIARHARRSGLRMPSAHGCDVGWTVAVRVLI